MSRVRTGSRLHFGLFRLPAAGDDAARRFGGIGLMIDNPGVEVTVRSAAEWSALGPFAERALAVAKAFLDHSPELESRPLSIEVVHCAPRHVGLGTGTQLGLAIARAIAVELGRPDWDAIELARRCGRGLRSGIGVHGFQHGGFLVDGGKRADTAVAPLVARHDFPEDWAVLLILPKDAQGVHGDREREAFAHLSASADRQTDALCRLVLMGILPALVERDLSAFGDALYEFNRKVGEMFQPWQGGVYAQPRTAAVIDLLRQRHVLATGQSSWGPAVFAIEREKRLREAVARLRAELGITEEETLWCRAVNRGATLGEPGA